MAVVTGGSQGIGYGVTHTLLKNGIAKVFILSTTEEAVKGAKEAIAKEMGQQYADRTVWKQCDLGDWHRTVEVAEEIKKETDRLDILVNNAGRGVMTYQLTDYGVDRHMAVNHMGHVALTSHLLPLLKETAKKGNVVRIVNQSSNLHEQTPKETRFDSLDELNTDLGAKAQYARSKLAAILYSRYFDRKVTQAGNPNVLMNASYPGFVSTKMSKEDIHEPFVAQPHELFPSLTTVLDTLLAVMACPSYLTLSRRTCFRAQCRPFSALRRRTSPASTSARLVCRNLEVSCRGMRTCKIA